VLFQAAPKQLGTFTSGDLSLVRGFFFFAGPNLPDFPEDFRLALGFLVRFECTADFPPCTEALLRELAVKFEAPARPFFRSTVERSLF